MRLSNMAGALRARGLNVIETAGWSSRGYLSQDIKDVRGVLWHHTATPSARNFASGAPTLGLCVNGRSDLAGPLCHILLGRGGEVYLVAAGLANHAGYGAAPGIPVDEGNWHLIGIEMESTGVVPWDWTAAQLRTAPILGAALEELFLLGRPAELRLQLGHLEYSSVGKIDPAGWPGGMDGLRVSINTVLAGWQKGGPVKPAGSAPAPIPAPAPAGDNRLSWTVEKGDTLGAIAEYYYGESSPATVSRLAANSGIKDPNRLAVGQKVYPFGPLVWTVEAGDTWWKVANYYGMAPETVAANNGRRTSDVLRVGEVLRII